MSGKRRPFGTQKACGTIHRRDVANVPACLHFGLALHFGCRNRRKRRLQRYNSANSERPHFEEEPDRAKCVKSGAPAFFASKISCVFQRMKSTTHVVGMFPLGDLFTFCKYEIVSIIPLTCSIRIFQTKLISIYEVRIV